MPGIDVIAVARIVADRWLVRGILLGCIGLYHCIIVSLYKRVQSCIIFPRLPPPFSAAGPLLLRICRRDLRSRRVFLAIPSIFALMLSIFYIIASINTIYWGAISFIPLYMGGAAGMGVIRVFWWP